MTFMHCFKQALICYFIWVAFGSYVFANNCHNHHNRNGRRCHGVQHSTPSNRNDDFFVRNYEEENTRNSGHNSSLRHTNMDRLVKKGDTVRPDSWSGRNSRGNSTREHDRGGSRNHLDHNEVETFTQATTTEAMNDIEKFLVGKRRKRSALWMNPNLYYNQGIGRSLSGNTNQDQEEEDEYEDDDEDNYNGHGSDNGRSSYNRHGNRDNSRESNFSYGGHGSGSKGHGNKGSNNKNNNNNDNDNNNDRPFFFQQRANPLFRFRIV